MAWFNADDQLHSHPKSRAAGLEAMGLWVLAGTYCTNHLTDGAVPQWFIDSWPRGPECAAKLCQVGLWEPLEPDGYQFLSWEEYQLTREQVQERKAAAAARKEKWRQDREQNKGK